MMDYAVEIHVERLMQILDAGDVLAELAQEVVALRAASADGNIEVSDNLRTRLVGFARVWSNVRPDWPGNIEALSSQEDG